MDQNIHSIYSIYFTNQIITHYASTGNLDKECIRNHQVIFEVSYCTTAMAKA